MAHETIGLQQKWGIYPFIERKNKTKQNKIELKLNGSSKKNMFCKEMALH